MLVSFDIKTLRTLVDIGRPAEKKRLLCEFFSSPELKAHW